MTRSIFYDKYDSLRFGWVALIGFACLAVVIAGPMAAQSHYDHKGCITYGRELHTAHRYSFAAGCRIQVGDRFVPLDNYRVNK